MTQSRNATLTVTAGPNRGDTVRIEFESCRLVGRHLSDNETVFLDRDGNRGLDDQTIDLISEHLESFSEKEDTPPPIVDAFQRGADIILADNSISRAHAMVFFDHLGLGVIDLASTNGTLVNAERISSARLSGGDVLALGESALTISIS